MQGYLLGLAVRAIPSSFFLVWCTVLRHDYTEIESSYQTKAKLVNKKEWIANCQRIALDTYSDTNDISPSAGTVAHDTTQEVTYLGEVWQVATYILTMARHHCKGMYMYLLYKYSLDHWLFKLYTYTGKADCTSSLIFAINSMLHGICNPPCSKSYEH